jgi:predicted  nucleic acid-binding Zn-ribbon protein
LKEQLEMLVQLQLIDLEQENLRQDVEDKRKKVEDTEAMLSELVEELEAYKEKFEDTQKLARSKKLELEEVKKGLETANSKILAVTNSRDYASAEREVENFNKMLAQIEDEIHQLKAAIAEGEARIEAQNKAVKELEKEIKKQRDGVEKSAAAITGKIDSLQESSKKIAKQVTPQILARYRFIRSRRAGVAVVSANDGTCSGCHMKLQPQAFIQLQKQTTLECCQNCQRILYFEAQELQAHA